MFVKRFSAILLCVAHLCLASCGGGGGSGGGGGGSVSVNRPPTALAGPSQTALTGAVVTLDGSSSSDPDGTALTFGWTLTTKPTGSLTTLSAATTANPSMRIDRDGAYILTLTVSDGSLSTSATTTVTAVSSAGDIAAATAANLSAIVDLGASLKLQWLDSFPAGASYRIETQATDGSWTTIEAIASVGGNNNPMLWSRAYGGAATYRVVALTDGREIPILSASGLAALNVDVPAGLQIAIDKAEPVSGVALLSVTAAPSGSSVAWTVDGLSIGSGNPLNWNTATVPDAAHAMLAHLSLGGDVAVDIRRTLTTSNPTLALSATDSIVATNTIRIDVAATSAAGITRVDLSVDGGAGQTLTSPNGCGAAVSCPLGFNRYQFSYNTLSLGSGNHVAAITATDTAGANRTISYPFSVANGPSLTLSTPSKGLLIGPTLQLGGSTTTDTGQPVTVRASLGTRQILTTTSANFSAAIVLASVPNSNGNPAGFTPGDYTLTVVATDSNGKTSTVQRPVVITSGTLQTPELLFVTDDDAVVHGVSGDLVLYRTSDQKDHIRNSQTGTVIDLAPTGTTIPTSMVLSTNWAFGIAQGADSICKTTDYCVYRWSTSTGAVSVLSNLSPTQPSPIMRAGREELHLRGAFLIWRTFDLAASSSPSSISIYDISTGVFSEYVPSTLGRGSASVGVSGGAPVVANVGKVGGASSANYGITTWTVAGGEKTAATVSFVSDVVIVNTDGTNVAFVTAVTPAHTGNLSLVPVGGGTPTSVGGGKFAAILGFDNSTLAWNESAGIQAMSQSQPKVLLSTTSTCPFSLQLVASGLVAHCKLGGSYTWNATTGVSMQRIETAAAPLFITGSWMYFKSGVNIYRLAVS